MFSKPVHLRPLMADGGQLIYPIQVTGTRNEDGSSDGSIQAFIAKHDLERWAAPYEAEIAGKIAWKDGVVTIVNVWPDFKHKGIGSELWWRAVEFEPNLLHSETLDREGPGWIPKIRPKQQPADS